MQWSQINLRMDSETQDLLMESFRTQVFTVGILYLIWHFIATLWWPDTFGYSIWLVTLTFGVVILLTVRLTIRYYILAQLVWQAGLAFIILLSYHLYQHPEIVLLLVFLPLMASATIGRWGTILVELINFFLIFLVQKLTLLPTLDPVYATGVILGSIFFGIFGWGLTNNMLSALSSASYHYDRARDLLEETRHHRAEISKMLKERNQTNYQLERLNQMLQFARNKAEEARDDRDQFILAVSHELRSPLNFILGFSDLMVNSPETYAKQKKWPPGLFDDIQEIYRSSTHLLGLINDILDLGQIDAKQMTIYREQASLKNLISDVRKMSKPAFSQKGLSLKVESNVALPPVFIDTTRIRQVILNLVNNGLRFTESGGVIIRILRKDQLIKVEVEDTGMGIAEEDLPKVFEAFRQVGKDSWRRREGSGLGLAISKRFIELHGGEMGLESNFGKGSTFYFTIPIFDPTNKINPIVDDDGWYSVPRYTSEKQEPLILLLAADSMTGRIIQQSLDTYKVVTVDKIEELPDMISKLYPQAIFVDKSIPLESQLKLREFPYDLPVIGIYLPGMIDSFQSLPDNVNDYLVKPVNRDDLIQAVNRLGDQVTRILVVDDDPAMVRFTTQAIKTTQKNPDDNQPFEFLSANTGQEALEQIHKQSIDAVLLDLDLPDMSGWDVLEKIQNDPLSTQIPVIIISATDFPQILYTNGRQVFDVMMRRPFSKSEISAVLQAILSSVKPIYPRQSNPDFQKPPANPAA
ncbi:MAG: response regulator [Anaerolineaceae bacterium]|nr:response regulator [Anaerolineaceae bacterium]